MSGSVLLASSLLLALFFGSLYREKRQAYLWAWSFAWILISVSFVLPLIGLIPFSPAAPLPEPGSAALNVMAMRDWFLLAASLAFVAAARLYASQSPWKLPLSLIGAASVVWAVAYSKGWVILPVTIGAGVMLLLTARTFLHGGQKQDSRSDFLLALAFAAWGFLVLLAAIQPATPSLTGIHLQSFVIVPQFFAGVVMVMGVYEEQRRRVERNMLALSSLNLATSTFTGSEIPKMLAQALDRVLNVVRIPAGALCLHYGEKEGPTSVVASGLNDTFCAALQSDRLDHFVVEMVSRLGGLMVLHDLDRSANWEALEREAGFKKIRQELLAQGLNTVVGISLQSKERVFGVLLLGTPDRRQFTAAELRLLLALGHQIGMAVENSYLIQQTSRRSEELHILNEIGRVLSSTLETDALFERIYSEMSRLLDVSSFYIAFYEPGDVMVRFQLEIDENDRMPQGERPAGNHLTEYIVQNRQPILIRDNVREQLQRLGIEPIHNLGCFCGVPLVLHDHAIGVMAVHSARERVFDEGHLEMLRVLASQASIAIENARLFGEEQRKARHLSLLNAISSHAITTLNPEEMLWKIASEMEKGLTYDHIGIAILDYSTKEVVVQAEAGTRRDALGRRIPIGEGLIGHVARSGQAEIVREVRQGTLQTVLQGTVCAAALPVLYADQMLGVLYVESAAFSEFTKEEMQLLRTLADLFAGALHNALTFQKAQEQAITDGLTGAKTHRFLMEALSAEWKRSTRATRQFALVLMDLDRFKFVNDFYGHLEGDVVLQRVAHILEQNCRRSDVVARYGGDEFVILMPETSVEQARQLASKLRGWVASDPLLRDKNITASFGIAGFPVHGSTPQELIQVADSSMYLSKHRGGNAVSTPEPFDPGKTKLWKQDVLEAYLGVALKRQFSTGPEAFDEIRRRIEQFTRSLAEESGSESIDLLPPTVVETVTSLALAVDAKDQYTHGHSQKVSEYAALLAASLQIDPSDVEEIRLAALLHDVGKVGIPEAILNKSGPLDASEWEVMKSHTELGARLLEPLRAMARIQLMVKHHHEYFDGSGYPNRLTGEQIPLGARVIAIADAFDTITSERAYKKPRPIEDALAEIERCAASQFDPKFVQAFVDIIRKPSQPQPQTEPELNFNEEQPKTAAL
jgi:diguanylate cyclase (GGDEF)-like protein/putative nucleotidyltransferase with HDIG domain